MICILIPSINKKWVVATLLFYKSTKEVIITSPPPKKKKKSKVVVNFMTENGLAEIEITQVTVNIIH